jgi:hypothetical protein
MTVLWLAANEAPRAGAASAEPMPETIRAWGQYVSQTEARIARELASPRFLAVDLGQEPSPSRAALRQGTVLVTEADGSSGSRTDVPSGTIHHWRGAMFIPDVTLAEVLAASADPAGHRQEDVLEARVLRRTPDGLRLFLKIQRKLIVSAVYNTEHDVTFRRHGPSRASSTSVAARIAEVENAGTPGERELSPGMDRGFLWRLNAYWRYEAAPDGVFVEIESLSLSRAVPWGLGTVVRPLANRVARESMVRTLEALRARFPAAGR